MTAVWGLDLPAGDKLVLLALADCANDEGACWPGIRSLMAKTGKCERSLQAAIKSLEKAEHLTRNEVPGKGCNYIVHPRNYCAPAITAPPQKTTKTPAKIAGKPLRTIIGESETREAAILALPQWSAFKAMRTQIKKPLNPTAVSRLLIKLIALADDGYPPGGVLDQSTEHCWQGVFKIEEREDGRTINRPNLRSVGGPRPDPTLAIVRAAIEAQRQSGGDYR